MPYDTREARHLLAAARAAKYPHDYTANCQRAAAALVAEVLAVAKSIGFNTASGAQPGIGAIIPNPNASGRIELASDERGVYVQVTHMGQVVATVSAPPIEYDAATDQWVGNAPDSFIVPTPGEPLGRRSAVAVVVDAVTVALQRVP